MVFSSEASGIPQPLPIPESHLLENHFMSSKQVYFLFLLLSFVPNLMPKLKKKSLENKSSAIPSLQSLCVETVLLQWLQVMLAQGSRENTCQCTFLLEICHWGSGGRLIHSQPLPCKATLFLFFMCPNLFTLDLILNFVKERKRPQRRKSVSLKGE